MAGETTTTSANDVYFAEFVDNFLFPERRPKNVMIEFMNNKGVEQTNSFQWNIIDDPGVATASTEGIGFANTEMTTSSQSASLGTVGQMATLTDELEIIAVVNMLSEYGDVLQRSVAEKDETDATALLDDHTNTTATSGIDCTMDTIWRAHAALVGRDVYGQEVIVVHTTQATDAQNDGQNSTAAMYARVDYNGLDMATLDGYVFAPFGIPLYQTSLVPTANSGADRHGAIFCANNTYGRYSGWPTRVEIDRDITLPGTIVVASARYGDVEIQDAFGQGIVTDA